MYLTFVEGTDGANKKNLDATENGRWDGRKEGRKIGRKISQGKGERRERRRERRNSERTRARREGGRRDGARVIGFFVVHKKTSESNGGCRFVPVQEYTPLDSI